MILGIDYGLKNIGLATSEGNFATPAATLKVENQGQAVKAIQQLVNKWSIDKIIIGVSEGKSKDQAMEFGTKLETVLRLKVEFIDETLSSVEVHQSKNEDKLKEHSKAAAIILQRYLDSK